MAKSNKNQEARGFGFARLLSWTLTLAVWGFIGLGGIMAWYAYDLPDVEEALKPTRQPTVTIVAVDGSTLATYGDLYGLPAQLKELPPDLTHAVLATEDRRFYDHFGLDLIGLARATVANILAGRIVQGGSTISQQVAKNIFLTPERSLKRKVQELLLALWLEHQFTKDQILSVYLNRVYLGAGTYGVEAAAQKYFGKSARRLSTYEAALIAGLLKAPSRYNPLRDKKRSQKRTRQVLANMVAAGYLTQAQAKAARHLKKQKFANNRRTSSPRYFIDWVMAQVPDYVSPGSYDLTVVTTLDATLQANSEKAVRGALAGAGKKAKASEAAFVAMTPTGAIRAMVGGRNYVKSQFNRVTQARRQPGSAFKPVVYLAGLEAGLKPSSRILDAPIRIGTWSPRNFQRRHQGEVTLAHGLAQSINTVAVRVAEHAGRKNVVRTAQRLGITSPLKAQPSLALGTAEVSLLELVSAYAPFANGGAAVWPHGITEIRDGRKNVLYRRQGSGPSRIIDSQNVRHMNAMLGRVVQSGTGRNAKLDRPTAGKTGTSQNYRDAWFIGYTADLAAGVWFGNDNGRPMRKVTGGGLPAKLWHKIISKAHAGLPVRALPGITQQSGAPIARRSPQRKLPTSDQGFWARLMSGLTGNDG
ncbi:MAG: PBP1A family penicillin-binding protein [Rhodospirillaceae bacterium]|jgi:penicillin-binding protein 1A|nr:PBP1A family penicillin-binding protein [Rhodospirillales bacterium]MBT3907744.1 PBP1A family penicillin-binding protein [Rhodospirillaceae bacterium]MBT4700103.1 PBP1A family penicillin-binding protein [Rhodospirillaceae bacterium]MBT5035168.1 PBP1A family penicillin-binding protein [Rhodospirillaceae bacterium]MBT6220167.1 PBP1A family penicillin-binding protein [Rhodospirillaceae bacterium]